DLQELPLEIVIGHAVAVGDAERADTGGGEIKRGGAAQSAGANDQHARRGELCLAGDADFAEQEVPAVARKLGRREVRRRIGHRREGEPEARAPQMKLRPRARAAGIAPCVASASTTARAASGSLMATTLAWPRRSPRSSTPTQRSA